MPKLPRIDAAQMVRALHRARFTERRQKGGHLTMAHAETGRRVTIPMHPSDMPVRLTHRILKQAGLTPDELRELLR